MTGCLLALLAAGLSSCREAQRLASNAPEYCRYAQIGPLCDSFDTSAIGYPVALGLRPLAIVDAFDQPILDAHVAAMDSRPRAVQVLAPVGPVPEHRRSYDRTLPQPFPRHGNPRLVVLALTPRAAPGRVDIHAFILIEDRVATSQLLASGLRAATLRGAVATGRFASGFSLTDRREGRGDLFRLRPPPSEVAGWPVEQWVANLAWQKTGADTAERRLDWFRSITNNGSCAGSAAPDPLLLAPVPQAWLDEYNANCPLRPPTPEFQPARKQA